jgi:flagellar hook assembly protein FlgD
VYNLQGQEIQSFALGVQAAGSQKVVWNGKNSIGAPLSSGVYVYRVRAVSMQDGKIFDKSAKMVLLK